MGTKTRQRKGKAKTRKRRSPIWTLPIDEFRSLVARCSTQTEILEFFDLENKGGNYRTLKARLDSENVDTSHIFCDPIGRNRRAGRRHRTPFEEILVRGSKFSRNHLKRRLLEEGLLGNVCSICGLDGTWHGKPLHMVLDHMNGIGDDNRIENLRMVCPNCGSQLPTHCGRNKSIHRRSPVV